MFLFAIMCCKTFGASLEWLALASCLAREVAACTEWNVMVQESVAAHIDNGTWETLCAWTITCFANFQKHFLQHCLHTSLKCSIVPPKTPFFFVCLAVLLLWYILSILYRAVVWPVTWEETRSSFDSLVSCPKTGLLMETKNTLTIHLPAHWENSLMTNCR